MCHGLSGPITGSKEYLILDTYTILHHLIFFRFGYVKHQLQGHEFTEGAELVSAISEILNQIPTDTLIDVFDDWMRRSQRCIDISGEYVE
jgi:hypothetical protein